ncbi:MAG: KTSC domain-containing protein [Methanothrix sp.]|nr:KTSC domain-containing protein [Methanothrix sp.]
MNSNFLRCSWTGVVESIIHFVRGHDYLDAPTNVFEGFKNTGSKGRYLATQI